MFAPYYKHAAGLKDDVLSIWTLLATHGDAEAQLNLGIMNKDDVKMRPK